MLCQVISITGTIPGPGQIPPSTRRVIRRLPHIARDNTAHITYTFICTLFNHITWDTYYHTEPLYIYFYVYIKHLFVDYSYYLTVGPHSLTSKQG